MREIFDVIAGTSIDGIVAAGLAVGLPAARIGATIESHGSAVFDLRIRLGRWRLPVRNRLRAAYRARYPQRPLRKVIGEIFGAEADRSLSSIETPLVIPAVEAATRSTQVLLSGGLAGRAASTMQLRDGLLGTTAAPTYFPPHGVGGRTFVDGGLVANARIRLP